MRTKRILFAMTFPAIRLFHLLAILTSSYASAATLGSINALPPTSLASPSTTETLHYLWMMDNGDTCTIKIAYGVTSGEWSLSLPSDIPYGHSTGWQPDINRYKGAEVIQTLGLTLMNFRKRITSGSLTSIQIGPYIAPEIWDPYLRGLRENLKKLPPHAAPSWSYFGKISRKTFLEISFIKEIQKVINHSGYTVVAGPINGAEKTPYFRREKDQELVDLLDLPNLNLFAPGNLLFRVTEAPANP